MKSTIGKVIYLGILPAMGTTLLLLALFMQEINMVTTNETLLKVFGLMMCATTWFAAFQYWNSFVREFTIQMTEKEHDEYSVELKQQSWLDRIEEYEKESQEHWMEEVK